MVGFSFFPRRRKSIGSIRIRSFTNVFGRLQMYSSVFIRSVLFRRYSLVYGSLLWQKICHSAPSVRSRLLTLPVCGGLERAFPFVRNLRKICSVFGAFLFYPLFFKPGANALSVIGSVCREVSLHHRICKNAIAS